MEFLKNANFLNTTSDDKEFMKKWIEVYDQSGRNCNINKEIRIKTSMLRSDLCDYSDAYIVVEEDIIVAKKYLQLPILRDRITQILMELILIMQITMRLVKKNWF